MKPSSNPRPTYWRRIWRDRKGQFMQISLLLGIAAIIFLSTLYPKLQVPVYAGLIFFMLPLSALLPAVRPIFFLDGKWKLALVLSISVILSYAIVSIFEIALVTSYRQDMDALFNPYGVFNVLGPALGAIGLAPKLLGKVVYCLLLATPLLGTVLLCSWYEFGAEWQRRYFWGIVLGILFSAMFGVALMGMTILLWKTQAVDLLSGTFLVEVLFSDLAENMRRFRVLHYQAFSFLLITLSSYFAWMLALRPGRRYIPGRIRFDPGALFFLLTLKAIVTLLMGVVVFYLNLTFPQLQIPALPAFLLAYSLLFIVVRIDHYFVLESVEEGPVDGERLDAEKANDLFQATHNRFRRHCSEHGTAVLVNLSGGGIQAAVWSVSVLQEIRSQLNASDPDALPGDQFLNSILSISSASGGSVASMFVVDQLQRHGAADYRAEATMEAASNDVLDVAGWGIAFLDVWRLPISILIWLRILPKRYQHKDRGWALEQEWDFFIRDRGREAEPPRLADWREAALQGEIPIPIFQSTIASEGRLLLISPISLHPVSKHFRDVVDFRSRFPEFTLKVSTAARLSATFPYISPICRSDSEDRKHPLSRRQEIYAADGGYFENYGVFTSVQLLDSLLESGAELGIRRVLLLNVEAFPKRMAGGRPARISLRDGLAMAFIGPMKAISGALFKSQQVRNEGILRLVTSKSYFEKVEVVSLNIPFPNMRMGNRRRYSPPLSWKLTRKQKEMVAEALERVSDPEGDESCQLHEAVQQWKLWRQMDAASARTRADASDSEK